MMDANVTEISRLDGEVAGHSSNSRVCVRARIFKAAGELFYRRGIRAVSVDLIAKEAGTTKMTLYRYFPSKETLVMEWLREHSESFKCYLEEITAQYPNDPRRQLSAFFEHTAELIADPGGRGCPIANAAVELAEPGHPARGVIEAHKADLLAHLLRLCRGLNAEKPEELADALFLLVEGAHASTQTLGCAGPGRSIATAAERLIEAHLEGAAFCK